MAGQVRFRLLEDTIKDFIWEEKAQAAMEYVMLTGGVIAAAVSIASIYMKMISRTAQMMDQSVANVLTAVEQRTLSELAK